MATLLLQLVGPMQAWGVTSRFDERDSGLEPSKSGVIGLLCAALGRDRAEPVDDLAALRMGVRVDREGLLMRDYQTVLGTLKACGELNKEPVVSPRFYLADAAFLVGLEGSRTLLDTLQNALKQPVWPLSLGRKSMPPGKPVWLADGVRDTDLLTTLEQADYLTEPLLPHDTQPLRLMLEHPTEGAVRLDQPVAPFAQRRFGPRFVQSATLERRHAPDPTHA